MGPQGDKGIPGENGKDGEPGKSLNQCFNMSFHENFDFAKIGMIGAPGPRGDTGFPGKDGLPGSQGPQVRLLNKGFLAKPI